MTLDAQSVTTKDEKEVVAKGIIKYKIADLSKQFTDVYDAVDAISDVSYRTYGHYNFYMWINFIQLFHSFFHCLESIFASCFDFFKIT